MKKMNKKGFTLAELLIVVAIIAVLVAIAIPIFTAQLEKSREATDISNVRSGYATAIANYLTGTSTAAVSVPATQKDAGWTGQSGTITEMVDGEATITSYNAVTSGNNYTITINDSGRAVIS